MFEWLGHQAMRRNGVIALRYDFADVSLNGKSLGIYAVEEHFDKRLIEHNARREGPIIRFGEDLMWREIVQQVRPHRRALSNGVGDYLVSPIDGFQTDKVLASDELRAQYLRAIHMLELFREGQRATSEVFDVDLLATYFALTDLFGAEHGARWNNIRYYYNPVTSLLEPISFDLQGGQPLKWLSLCGQGTFSSQGVLVNRYDHLNRTLFQDRKFTAAYLRELERISQPDFLNKLLAETEPERLRALSILYTEFPYYEFSPDVLYRNQRYIRSVLNPIKGLHAYRHGIDEYQCRLQLGNIQYLPLEVIGVEADTLGVVNLPQPVFLSPRRHEQPIVLKSVHLDLPASADLASLSSSELRIRYKVLGSTQIRTATVTPYAYTPELYLGDEMIRQSSTVGEFDFVDVDDDRRKIIFLPGSWTIDRDLLIPSGYTVECGPATELDLVASSLIVSKSPLNWLGTGDRPVVIRSSDGTGQGLVVLQTDGPSTLDHVVFDHLTNPNRDGWLLTGAVTFYESSVALLHVISRAANCEDGVNLVRCTFSMEDCRFEQAGGDALDADFCEGTISETVFLNSANDAVDVSGSSVTLSQVTVDTCGDKAVSVGEASTVRIDDLQVRGARIAVASKDASQAIINNLTIQECEFGLVVFQKKAEFGPGKLEVFGLATNQVARTFLVEQGSSLTIDEVDQGANRQAVNQLLYGETGHVGNGH